MKCQYRGLWSEKHRHRMSEKANTVNIKNCLLLIYYFVSTVFSNQVGTLYSYVTFYRAIDNGNSEVNPKDK